jgi:hypothetical protein
MTSNSDVHETEKVQDKAIETVEVKSLKNRCIVVLGKWVVLRHAYDCAY